MKIYRFTSKSHGRGHYLYAQSESEACKIFYMDHKRRNYTGPEEVPWFGY